MNNSDSEMCYCNYKDCETCNKNKAKKQNRPSSSEGDNECSDEDKGIYQSRKDRPSRREQLI